MGGLVGIVIVTTFSHFATLDADDRRRICEYGAENLVSDRRT
mgnify:CR=1 FL=1